MSTKERLIEIAKGFNDHNERNGFNSKTFESCGTLVKNNDKETKDDAPLIGNIKVKGLSITLIGKFTKNSNDNDQISLRGFTFENEKVEEVKIDDFWKLK
jgi:hypothetical protein